MSETKLRQELTDLYNEILHANFNDKYQVKESFFRLIRLNEKLIDELYKENPNKIAIQKRKEDM